MPEPATSAPSLIIAGVDEAGRGPWAGPVCAAAVILPDGHNIHGLTDSKKLSEAKRDVLAITIKQRATAWAIAFASIEEIDSLNIRNANFLAMNRALAQLDLQPTQVQIDGREIPPDCPIPAEAIIGGDGIIPAISAASILAKTARDAIMLELHSQYPQYGFAQHKGYGTAAHRVALNTHGICPAHRRSFKPMSGMLQGPSASGAT